MCLVKLVCDEFCFVVAKSNVYILIGIKVFSSHLYYPNSQYLLLLVMTV